MKSRRYLLFWGDDYYPNGGWRDFKGSFSTPEEALHEATSQKADWFDIVDTKLMEPIEPKSKRGSWPSKRD